MTKMIKLMIAVLLCLSLAGCSNAKETVQDVVNEVSDIIKEDVHIPVTIKESEDRHIAYIKDYVGKNCAMVGYASMGGDRNDYLGEGYLHLVLVTSDGSYVDIEDEEQLKEYVVVAQALEPNTEVTFEFDTDSNGEEYSWPAWQSVEEMVLHIKKVKEANPFTNKPTSIKIPENHYQGYIPDLVGRNLNATGYTSMGGDRRIGIGNLNLKLNIVTQDGSFIDIDDEELMKNYVVYAQSLEPNTELKFEYRTDSDGEEYSWIDHSNYEEMDIYVKLIER